MVSCTGRTAVESFEGQSYVLGFGVSDIAVEDPASLYIAACHNGWKAVDVPNRGVIVCSTHDHAGADTLGLWGPVAIDGKDSVH